MMTSLKTKYLLFLAAFLFLSTVPTVARVVDSVANCNQYLLQTTPPQVPGILVDGNILDENRYKPICQTYVDEPRFLTLYDTTNKIPVFSAYKYIKEQDTKRPPDDWKIEPQLENKDDKTENMVDVVKNKTYNNQAGDINYKTNPGEKEFDRGHLFPSTHASTTSDKESTMTLTNIVPQEPTFNQGSWRKMEECIKSVMKTFCINSNNVIEGFVVTGAQPSSDNKLNRVNIPSVLWTAFCCYNSSMDTWIASAHWGKNDQNDPGHLQSQTLTQLSNNLRGVDPFPGTQCPRETNLGDYENIIQTIHECKPN